MKFQNGRKIDFWLP